MPMMRKDDGDESGSEKRETRQLEEAAMWSSSSRTKILHGWQEAELDLIDGA